MRGMQNRKWKEKKIPSEPKVGEEFEKNTEQQLLDWFSIQNNLQPKCVETLSNMPRIIWGTIIILHIAAIQSNRYKNACM